MLHLRLPKKAAHKGFHSLEVLAVAVLLHFFAAHVHGVDKGRGHALGRKRTVVFVIHEKGKHQALKEAAHHTSDIAKIDGAAKDKPVRLRELFQHRGQIILDCAMPIALAAHPFTRKTAYATLVAEIIQVDHLCFHSFATGCGCRAVQSRLKQLGGIELLSRATVYGVNFHYILLWE